MATLTTSLNTAFTPPAATPFAVQCTGGAVTLEREQTNGAGWCQLGAVHAGQAFIVDNPVAGMRYRFVLLSGQPVPQADQ